MLVPLLSLPILAVAALLARHRAVAYALAVAALVPPCWPGAPPLLRFVLAIAACGGFGRIAEIVDEPTIPAWERVLRVLLLPDVRTRRRAPPRVELRRLGIGIAALTVTAGAMTAALSTRPGALWPAWVLGAIAVWSLAEAVDALLGFSLGAFGIALAPLHDRPLASRSLAELWGRRWNLTVTRWLHAHVFSPLARRGRRRVGVVAAFALSAIFHAYIASAAAGIGVGLTMGAFFVVQGALMLVERRLHLGGSRVWFFVAILLPSPLFVEPMIAIVRPSASPLTARPCSSSCP